MIDRLSLSRMQSLVVADAHLFMLTSSEKEKLEIEYSESMKNIDELKLLLVNRQFMMFEKTTNAL